MIAPGSRVIDVGCDHGLMDIYLAMYQDCKCVAADVNEKALSSAVRNIKKYNLNDEIETVISYGLTEISVNSTDVVVIAGMGTHTIMEIIKGVVADTLIIQSNNDLELLRFYITHLGYYIDMEKVVYERGQYYVIIRFYKGRLEYDDMDYILGPIIRKDRSNRDYFLFLLRQYEFILEHMPDNVVYASKREKFEIIKKELNRLI